LHILVWQTYDSSVKDQCVLWRELDPREEARLDLVGLACELTTVATLVEEAMRQVADPHGLQLAQQARALAARASSVLSRATNFDVLRDAVLHQAIVMLREDRGQLLRVRQEATELVKGVTATPCRAGTTGRHSNARLSG
jgi:hypothetical protein